MRVVVSLHAGGHSTAESRLEQPRAALDRPPPPDLLGLTHARPQTAAAWPLLAVCLPCLHCCSQASALLL